MSSKPKTAIVFGLGREGSHLFSGDEVLAELVKPIGQGFWWVRFENDVDERGRQILRVRRVL